MGLCVFLLAAGDCCCDSNVYCCFLRLYVCMVLWNNDIMSKVKTTVMLDKTLKKLAQIYGLNNEVTLGEVIEQALKAFLEKRV